MDPDKMLVLAMMLREFAAQLIDNAEQIEIKARIERAKVQPEIGNLLAKLVELEEIRKNLKNRSLN